MKYVKYRAQKEQVSYDGGVTWEDTGRTRKGEYIDVYDSYEESENTPIPQEVIPVCPDDAKALLVLDTGSTVKLPFVGARYADESTKERGTDDYALTNYDISLCFVYWEGEYEDYVAQHCTKIIINSRIIYVCGALVKSGNNYTPADSLGFTPCGMVGAVDRRGYYKNLREIYIPDTTTYVSIDGSFTILSKVKYPSTTDTLVLNNMPYLKVNEFIMSEDYNGRDSNNTAKKVISYSNSFPRWQHVRTTNTTGGTVWKTAATFSGFEGASTFLLYNTTVPSTFTPLVGGLIYVRDELYSNWIGAYRSFNYTNQKTIPFFPLSFYNVGFRDVRSDEKFLARLSDGTLYSIPVGDGVVKENDVKDIWSRICDIKFGPGVVTIDNGVFGYHNVYNSGNPRHHINVLEINSDVNVGHCDVATGINKIKLNGTNFINSLLTDCNKSLYYPGSIYYAAGEIYVPDEAFESYFKSMSFFKNSSNKNEMDKSIAIRSKLRPMSKFNIND